MFSLLFITVFGIFLFTLGYYFGHQIGSTHHIRQQLSETRKNPSND